MPKLDELEGCLAADRTDLSKRIKKLKLKKLGTRKDTYGQYYGALLDSSLQT